MPHFCTTCGHLLAGSAACSRCLPQAHSVQVSESSQLVSTKIVATGRTRTAGLILSGSGAAIALSAFLPWVTAFGIASASPSGGGVVVLLVLGGAVGILSAQVLRYKATKPIRILSWVLAAVDGLAVLGLFAASKSVGQTTGSFGVDVGQVLQPAAGFYLAMLALVAGVVGTIVLQTAKSAPTHSGQTLSATHGQLEREGVRSESSLS
jgi:hypothetical protein